MQLKANPAKLRKILDQHRTQGIGFVPTMGYLHQGHLSLIEASKKAGLFTLVSIFVNPTQFGPNEDLDSYPREHERDYALAIESGADLVWFPTEENLYPKNSETSVLPGALSKKLCGLSRPKFFPGICTVVLKLFNLIQPDKAYFGEKDFQQLTLIRRMVADFFLPVEVVGCATVREPDGLAMSSRNAYLKPEDRATALTLFRTIAKARRAFLNGNTHAVRLKKQLIAEWPESMDLDYLDFRDPVTLEEVETLQADTRIFLGAWLRGIRLIDNAALTA